MREQAQETKLMTKVRIPTDEELRRITERGVAEIVPHDEFVSALNAGKHLRLKQGFDPTRPVIVCTSTCSRKPRGTTGSSAP